jgi:hypothetical protein
MIEPKFDGSRLEGGNLGIGKTMAGIGKKIGEGRKQARKNYKKGAKELSSAMTATTELGKSGGFGDVRTPEGREKLENHFRSNLSPMAIKTMAYDKTKADKAGLKTTMSEQKKIRKSTAKFDRTQRPLGPVGKAVAKAKIKGLETVLNMAGANGPRFSDRRSASTPATPTKPTRAPKPTAKKPAAAKPVAKPTAKPAAKKPAAAKPVAKPRIR